MKFLYLLFALSCFSILLTSCNSGFDSAKFKGRYRIESDSKFADDQKGGVWGQLFKKALNASSVETTFDGFGNAKDHWGNEVVGFAAKVFGGNVDSDNIVDYTYKYKIIGDIFYFKYSHESEFKAWFRILSFSDDYHYLKVQLIKDNKEGELMQMIKVIN